MLRRYCVFLLIVGYVIPKIRSEFNNAPIILNEYGAVCRIMVYIRIFLIFKRWYNSTVITFKKVIN